MGQAELFYSILTLLILTTAATTSAAAEQEPLGACNSCDDVYWDENDQVDVKFVAMLALQRSSNHECTHHSFSQWKAALAMKWAVEMLNGQGNSSLPTNRSFIPGIKIGLDIINSCSLPSKASFHTGRVLTEHTRHDRYCGRNYVSNHSSPSMPIVGILGTSMSETTTIVADILRHRDVPLIGVSATLHALSDKTQYPAFIRAVPSDVQQTQTIVALAKHLKWSYMVGIHSDSQYGRVGMQEVRTHARNERLCIAHTEEISESFMGDDDKIMDLVRGTLFSKLDQTTGVLGVVFFGEYDLCMKLLQYVDREQLDRITAIQWILPDAVPLTDDLKQLLSRLNHKAYLIGPTALSLPSFTEYLLDHVLSAPPSWLSDQWKSSIKQALAFTYNCADFEFKPDDVARCDLRSKISHTSYLAAAVDSVYILASLLKKAQRSQCGNIEGVCTQLQEDIENGLLKVTSFEEAQFSYDRFGPAYVPQEFIDNQRSLVANGGDLKVQGQDLYSVTQHSTKGGVSTFKEIAVADAVNNLVFSDTTTTTTANSNGLQTEEERSECENECSECLPLNDVSYVYQPGEVILIGVFSLHTVSETDPFRCGDFRDTTLDYVAMQAFVNIINQQNKDGGSPTFGYLIIDDCYSPVRSSKFVSDVLGRVIEVVDKESGQVLNPDHIHAVIGANTSPSTMAMLMQLKDLHIPVVSYAATTPSLNNRIIYPYFSRTVPSDTLMADAFVKILKAINVSYVGVLALDNIYGLELDRLFKEKAEKEFICVERSFPMDVYTKPEDIENYLGELGAKGVRAIILTISTSIIEKVLESKTVKDYNFHFISSETWDLSSSVIADGRGKNALGSFVFEPSSWVQFDAGLRDHVNSLNAFSEDSPVWLREFWEGFFQCDMPDSFSKRHDKTCSTTTVGGNVNFFNSTKNLRTSVATFSTVNAIKAIKREQSELFDQGVGPELAKALTEKIRATTIDGTPVFNSEGNGNSNLDIYNVQRNVKDIYTYERVGTIRNDGVLTLDVSLAKYYDKWGIPIDALDSSCENKPECPMCGGTSRPSVEAPSVSKEPVSTTTSDDSDTVVLVVICVILVLVLLALVVIFVLVRMGKIRCFGVTKASSRYSEVTSNGSNPNPVLPPRPADNRTNSSSDSSSRRYDLPGNYYTGRLGEESTSTASAKNSSGESGGRIAQDIGGVVDNNRADDENIRDRNEVMNSYPPKNRDRNGKVLSFALSDTVVNGSSPRYSSEQSISSATDSDRRLSRASGLSETVVNSRTSSEISTSSPVPISSGRSSTVVPDSGQTLPFAVSANTTTSYSSGESSNHSGSDSTFQGVVTENSATTTSILKSGNSQEYELARGIGTLNSNRVGFPEMNDVNEGGGLSPPQNKENIAFIPLDQSYPPPAAPRPHQFRKSKFITQYVQDGDNIILAKVPVNSSSIPFSIPMSAQNQTLPTFVGTLNPGGGVIHNGLLENGSTLPAQYPHHAQQHVDDSQNPPLIAYRPSNFPNDPANPQFLYHHGVLPTHQSVTSNGVIIGNVPPQAVYNTPRNHDNNNNTVVLERGYSNPAFVHSPGDEFAGSPPTQQMFIQSPSTLTQGTQPRVVYSINNSINPYDQQQQHQQQQQQLPRFSSSYLPPPTVPITNVAYVLSNPPPPHTLPVSNPTPHRQPRIENDYLDPEDPPFPYSDTGTTTITTMPRPIRYPSGYPNQPPITKLGELGNSPPQQTFHPIRTSNTTPSFSGQNVPTQTNSAVENARMPRVPTDVHHQPLNTHQAPTSATRLEHSGDMPAAYAIPSSDLGLGHTPPPFQTPLTSNVMGSSEEANDKYDNDDNNNNSKNNDNSNDITNSNTKHNNVQNETPNAADNIMSDPAAIMSPDLSSTVSSTSSTGSNNPVSLGFQPHSKLSMDNNNNNGLVSDSLHPSSHQPFEPAQPIPSAEAVGNVLDIENDSTEHSV